MAIFSKKINIVGLLMLLLWSSQLVAQDGTNPFDLQQHADKQVQHSDLSDGQEAATLNPFELRHRTDKRAKYSKDSGAVEEPTEGTGVSNPFNVTRIPEENNVAAPSHFQKEKKTSAKISKVVEDKNFRFWLTLMMLVFLALISSVYRSQLKRAYRAFSNENVMRMLHREKGTVTYFPYYILYALFVLNAGIYIYLLLRHYKEASHVENLSLLGYVIGGVALLLLLKHMVISFLGMIFPIQKETSIYNMTITIFGVILSLVLFVFNILIAYVPTELTPIFIYISFFIIGSIYIFRSIRGLSIGSKFLNHNKFHFFIYLCSLEIAPALILWKILANGAGIQ